MVQTWAQVTAKIEPIEMMIGEQTQVTITVQAPEGATVEMPVFQPRQQLIAGVEVINSQRTGNTLVLTLTSFDGNLYHLPPFAVKVNGKVVENSYVTKIFSYVFLYLFFVSMGAFVLTLCGSNIPNAFCMAAANIGNLGPSPVINNLGASLDYVQLMPVAKWAMMLLMLAGRLEIFAVVAVLMPAYWRRRN